MKKENQAISASEIQGDEFLENETLRRVFFEEISDILNQLDKSLMQTPSNQKSSDLIRNFFQKIHTIKGISGATPGADNFGKLAQKFEFF